MVFIFVSNNVFRIARKFIFFCFYYNPIMSELSEMVRDYDEGKRLAQLAISKIKREDIIHRGFLKPIEVALKTHQNDILLPNVEKMSIQNQHEEGDEEKQPLTKPNSLPNGLKIAVKKSICDNRYTLRDLLPVEGQVSYQALKQNNQDNILSLLKTPQGLQLAICICMYSQDKKMLKSTLAGVSENIAALALQEGISPDKVGVFVVMDGIEKVDESVIDYFQELQRSSGISLGQNLPPSLSIDDLIKRRDQISQEEIDEEELKNINNILFNAAQLQDRNQRSFPCVHAEYSEIKALLTKIEELKKKKTLFDDLPAKVRPFFLSEAREQKKKLGNLSEQQTKWISQQSLIQQFALDIRKARPLVIKALQQCQRFCKQYIQSRDELAYLGIFRTKVRIQIQESQKSQQLNTTNQKFINSTDRHFVDDSIFERHVAFMNLFLCIKYKNSGKLSSHNWFFNGFCKQLKPKYTVLLDVGLRPHGQALLKMYRYMKNNPQVGGVCGYMSLKIEQMEEEQEAKLQNVDFLTRISLSVADIQRTQQVEYHFAHLIDKGFQAAFGFIHVLPGAFSAYNMKAIINYNSTRDDPLLRSYFKSIDDKLKSNKIIESELHLNAVLAKVLLPDVINRLIFEVHPQSEEQMLYNQNIYLAEDRILCMGIHKKGYDIKFLPDAYAQVDPIKTVHGLLGQRKRWINGSFFAFQKVKKQLSLHQQRSGFQCCLNIQIFYLTLMNFLSYLSPSFFLFTIHIAMDAFRADVLAILFGSVIGDPQQSNLLITFVYFADFIYVMMLGCLLYMSLHLTNNNQRYKPYIYAISTIFGIFAFAVFLVLLVDVIRGLSDNATFLIQNKKLIEAIPGGYQAINSMRWILIISTLIFAIPIALYTLIFKKLHIACQIILGAFSFLFYGPTYFNILNIYSLCRIDDISWGTKGLDAADTSRNNSLKTKWYLIKMVYVGKFILWNIVLSVVLLSLGSSYKVRFFITIIMVSVIGFMLIIKIIIAVGYLINYRLSQCCQTKIQSHQDEYQHRKDRIQQFFDRFTDDIKEEVRAHLFNVAHRYDLKRQNDAFRSFIQISRAPDFIEHTFQKQRQDFLSRSKLSPQPSFMDGLTEKKTSNNYTIRLLNDPQLLPIQTNVALDYLDVVSRKPSYISMDKRISQFSLDKRASIQSLDKKASTLQVPDKKSSPSLEKYSSQVVERNSSPSLQKHSSYQSMQKRLSKPQLDKKSSFGASIKQQSVQQQQQVSQFVHSQIQQATQRPDTSYGEESEENVDNGNPRTTEVIYVNPRKKRILEQAAPSRFKPEEK